MQRKQLEHRRKLLEKIKREREKLRIVVPKSRLLSDVAMACRKLLAEPMDPVQMRSRAKSPNTFDDSEPKHKIKRNCKSRPGSLERFA